MMRYMLLLIAFCIALGTNAQSVKNLKGESFGDGIKSSTYVGYDELLNQLNSRDTVDATVHAVVNEVCQAKGCWMTLDGDTEMMVRFKDYGFFVPKNIGGREVVIEGQAFTTVVPVEELRHYAEDAGKSKEEIAAITEPETKLAFTATGVLVVEE